MSDFFSLGAITAPHGLKGEMKLFPFSPEAETFQTVKHGFLGNEGDARQKDVGADRSLIHILSLKPAGKFYLLKLEGIDSREDAEKVKGKILFVPKTEVAPLDEGTWFIDDLIGLTVETGAGECLGTVSDIQNQVAQDLFLVDKEGEARLYLPVTEHFLVAVDFENKKIVYDPPLGLIELYRNP